MISIYRSQFYLLGFEPGSGSRAGPKSESDSPTTCGSRSSAAVVAPERVAGLSTAEDFDCEFRLRETLANGPTSRRRTKCEAYPISITSAVSFFQIRRYTLVVVPCGSGSPHFLCYIVIAANM